MAEVCPAEKNHVKNSRGRPQKIDINMFKNMYERGITDGEIAKTLGVDRSTIAKIRKKLDLVSNRPQGQNRRAGTGKKREKRDEEEAALQAWMRHAQAVNAAEMSRKTKITAEKMVSWARSAYVWKKPAYISREPVKSVFPEKWVPPGW